MNYIGLNKFDTANGDGVRVSLFVSGCTLHCKGCFNKESWNFDAGKPFTEETIQEIERELANPLIEGFSLLGGDPLEPNNLEAVTSLCARLKAKFPEKSIWLWTGRRLEKVAHLDVMKYLDCVIDGAFVEKLKITTKGEWRGSSNQRVIHLKKNRLF